MKVATVEQNPKSQHSWLGPSNHLEGDEEEATSAEQNPKSQPSTLGPSNHLEGMKRKPPALSKAPNPITTSWVTMMGDEGGYHRAKPQIPTFYIGSIKPS